MSVPSFSGNIEETLVRLCIAIENNAIGEALDIIDTLQRTLRVSEDSPVMETLSKLHAHLEEGNKPPQELLDMLTVLLAGYE